MRISDWSSDVCSSDLLQSRSPRTLPMTPSTSVARLAASLPVAPGFAATGQAILAAANLILPDLERGRAIDARALRPAMENAFHGSARSVERRVGNWGVSPFSSRRFALHLQKHTTNT